MHTHWLVEPTDYDGSQLRAHWILRTTGLIGDAMVAFRGRCASATTRWQTWRICSRSRPSRAMTWSTFVLEIFDDGDLVRAVVQQRLLSAIAFELLRTDVLSRARGVDSQVAAASLRRDGDDIFLGDGKLSISIATKSLVSTLIHFAVNVENSGTPVPTSSLRDLGVDPESFGRQLLEAFAAEQASMRQARVQVRAKGESGA